MENFAGADLHKTVDRHMTFGWSSSRLTERRLAALWYRIRWPLWFEGWTGRLDLFQAPDFYYRLSCPTREPSSLSTL